MNMKTNLLSLSALALVAIAFVSAGPVAAVASFAVAGVLTVFLSDYSRSSEGVRCAA
jgi:hypothetical protein